MTLQINNQLKQTPRIASVDIFRLISAIMVVAIHTKPLTDINAGLGYFASEIFPRIGVPYFFTISGYFFIRSLLNGKNNYVKQFLHTLLIYTVWSFIYFFIGLAKVIVDKESIASFLKDQVAAFLITGSYYHLWFFPSLLFSMIIAVIAYKIHLLKYIAYISLFLYLAGCLGCSYYSIVNQIPYISQIINSEIFTIIRRIFLMGLPFFMLGYFIDHIVKFMNYSKVRQSVLLISSFILWILEIAIIKSFKLDDNIVLTLFLYPFTGIVIGWLLNNPMPKSLSHAHTARFTSNLMYYIHPALIITYEIAAKMLLKISVPSTIMFLLVILTTLIVGAKLSKADNPLINKIII